MAAIITTPSSVFILAFQKNPMATMQMPQYLGGIEYNINVNQVTNQSVLNSVHNCSLGEVGAVSVTC